MIAESINLGIERLLKAERLDTRLTPSTLKTCRPGDYRITVELSKRMRRGLERAGGVAEATFRVQSRVEATYVPFWVRITFSSTDRRENVMLALYTPAEVFYGVTYVPGVPLTPEQLLFYHQFRTEGLSNQDAVAAAKNV